MKRVGVVGMGKMGIVHASILNALSDVELAAIMDGDKGLRRYLHGIGITASFYPSLEEMLEKEKLDGVFLCVPSSANYSVAAACVERDISIFVEKPLANSLEDAEKMIELIAGKDLKHSVGFMVAHWPIFRKAKEILEENAIGKVNRVEASAYLSAVFSRQKGWFYRKQMAGGGAVTSLGSYLVLMLNQFFGPVEQVEAELIYSSGNEVEDGGRMEMKLGEGIEARMDISWSAPGYESMELEIMLLGSEGQLRVNNREIEIQLNGRGVTKIHISELPDEARFYLGGEGYCREDEDFVSCLGTDRMPDVTWREGYQVQRVLDAIYRSAEANRPVTLPGETR